MQLWRRSGWLVAKRPTGRFPGIHRPVSRLPVPPDSTDPSDDALLTAEEGVYRESIHQKLTQMGIPARVKAAMTGSREVRAILVRDPNRMISAAVLTSPKLTEAEVESFARMGSVSEDVLRIIGGNRSWMKNYGIMAALVKNAKTPLAMSLNLMHRLIERDLVKLSVDRNVSDPLRVAAKRKVIKTEDLTSSAARWIFSASAEARALTGRAEASFFPAGSPPRSRLRRLPRRRPCLGLPRCGASRDQSARISVRPSM